jgi:hypothetical protein
MFASPSASLRALNFSAAAFAWMGDVGSDIIHTITSLPPSPVTHYPPSHLPSHLAAGILLFGKNYFPRHTLTFTLCIYDQANHSIGDSVYCL